jgi:RNA polymerase sigma-70 factor, ECF subfamily
VSDAPDVEELCSRFGPMVLRRCRRLLGDDDAARDVCQDVFVRFIARYSRSPPLYPSSLLYRMATNLCLNRIRDRRRWPQVEDDDLIYRIACADRADAADTGMTLDWLFGRHAESTRTMAVLGSRTRNAWQRCWSI